MIRSVLILSSLLLLDPHPSSYSLSLPLLFHSLFRTFGLVCCRDWEKVLSLFLFFHISSLSCCSYQKCLNQFWAKTHHSRKKIAEKPHDAPRAEKAHLVLNRLGSFPFLYKLYVHLVLNQLRSFPFHYKLHVSTLPDFSNLDSMISLHISTW